MSAKKLTLAEISSELKISISTISKVLNGRDDVSVRTRKAIQDHLEKIGYQKNKPTKKDSDLSILIVLDRINTIYASEVVGGILNLASKYKIRSQIFTIHSMPKEEKNCFEMWYQHKHSIDGVIIIASHKAVANLQKSELRNIPTALVDSWYPGTHYIKVASANLSGGLSATKYLTSLGHRKIAYIAGPEEAEFSNTRLNGYHAALRSAGIEENPEYIIHDKLDFFGGKNASFKLFRLADPPTAIFAANDAMALGAIEGAREAGLRVPEDVSVVGFDGTDAHKSIHPYLSGVVQPMAEMGKTAFSLLRQEMLGQELPTRQVELPTGFNEGASVKTIKH